MIDDKLIKKLSQKDDIQLIILYYQGMLGDYVPTPAVEKKMEMLADCRDLIRRYGSRVKVVPMIKSMNGISQSQAERLYSDTMFLYNTTQTNPRDFWIDIAMGNILASRAKSIEAKDMRSATSADANMVRLIAQMPDTKESEIYKRLHVAPRTFVFKPELTGVKLPDNWKEQVEQIINNVRSRNLLDIPEAEEVREEDNGARS